MSSSDYPDLITRDKPTLGFIGVTTGQSSSMRMFPKWAQIMGLPDAQLAGVDLPLDAPREDYRRAVAQIKYDPLSLGALVTSHKLNLYAAAHDLFDGFSDLTQMTQEISCIYKRDGRLIGHTVDPITAGRAMRQYISPTYFPKNKAHILCLGGGGAAIAIATYLCTREEAANRPARVLVVDIDPARRDHFQWVVGKKLPQTKIRFEFVLNDRPEMNDRLMASMPDGSLIINATGMGKDRPGSPLTDDAVFPQNGIAWDLNYRGELDFLQQARQQMRSRKLMVIDGWDYFLHGWSMIAGLVFDVTITPEMFDQLADAAAEMR